MEADERASVATRRRKNPEWTQTVLAGRWQTEAVSVALPTGPELIETLRHGSSQAAKPNRGAVFDALVDPETGLCAHDSRFGEAQVIERIAAAGARTLTVEEITGLAQRFLPSPVCAPHRP
jgi:hypothetical protein